MNNMNTEEMLALILSEVTSIKTEVKEIKTKVGDLEKGQKKIEQQVASVAEAINTVQKKEFYI